MTLPQPGLLAHLRSSLPTMTGAEQRMVEWIQSNPARAMNLSIRELSENAGVSEATVVRTCQRLGYDGFPQFKLALAFDLSLQAEKPPAVLGSVQIDDDVPVIVNKVFQASVRNIERSLEHLDMERFQAALEAVMKARKIEVFSGGTQAHVVERVCAKFINTGIIAIGRVDQAQQLSAAALLEPSDVLLLFSHSGRWRHQVKAVELAKERGATTIAVTNFPHSPLARSVDVPIITHTDDDQVYYNGAMGSEMVQMLFVDCLVLSIAHFRRETVLQNLVSTRKVVDQMLRM